ncbi:MAG TPA: asparagine synthase (glutamine-hydrolyzing) [Streptosporangiales bacterium]
MDAEHGEATAGWWNVCGIVGWAAYERDLTSEQPTVQAMTDTMACRGPDAEGTWLRRHAGLGHRRLAVIDLPGGSQPMTREGTDGGDVGLVFSGEIYNYVELRDELRRRGHTFRTDSDTEVVLVGYLEWGAALAERLNGMYAFAVWDDRDERLHLVRDRMGVKPLYYYPTDDGVLFASEPKGILENPLARRVVSLDGLREIFGVTKTPGHGIWEGMREVEPGTVVTVDRNGARAHVYWRLTAVPHTDDRDTTVARVRELLDDIVARQLVADVPRCVLLSGGLDSSAITALSAGRLARDGEQVRTFAVDFVGQTENFKPDAMRDTPDTPYVHDVAEHVHSRHEDIVLDAKTLADPDARRAVIRARDIPAGLGDMDKSLYLLFKAIRAHSTVALSGESADEVFGGYRWFHDEQVQRADMFPWIAQFARYRGNRGPGAMNADLMRRLDLVGHLRARYAEAVAEVPTLEGESEHEARMRRISYLHLTRFVRILLDRKDRMSMAVGLEVRVPFCDHRLVEYVFNAPWALKTYDGREKSLLRGATADVLPRSVVERVKSPYPSTQDPRYAAELQHHLADAIAHGAPGLEGLYELDALRRMTKLPLEQVSTPDRMAMERALDIATWLEMYRPELRLS